MIRAGDPPVTGEAGIIPRDDTDPIPAPGAESGGSRVRLLAHILGIDAHAEALRNVLQRESERLKEAAG